jgi:hypothetical protein
VNNEKMTAKVIKRKFLGFQTLRWAQQGFNLPAPQWVKLRFLRSNQMQDGDWIETGTYLGDTSLALSKSSPLVITLEPSQELYDFSSARLRARKNVNCLLGTSEEQFANAISLVGDKVNIWLDGHYSGDITHLGATETPLFFELLTSFAFTDFLHTQDCPQPSSPLPPLFRGHVKPRLAPETSTNTDLGLGDAVSGTRLCHLLYLDVTYLGSGPWPGQVHFALPSKFCFSTLPLSISTPFTSLSFLVTAGYPSLPYLHVPFCHNTPGFSFSSSFCA